MRRHSWGEKRGSGELARTLGRFPVFSGCSPAELEALAAAGRVTSLPAHWTFLHEGTPADACYVLLEGEVHVLRGGRTWTSLGPGAVLGEMALLGHSLRRASVVTTTATSALHVDYTALVPLLLAHPRLQDALGAVYDQHLDADHKAAQDALAGARR